MQKTGADKTHDIRTETAHSLISKKRLFILDSFQTTVFLEAKYFALFTISPSQQTRGIAESSLLI